jgi:tetratricopeptide (TPR) repeat protein
LYAWSGVAHADDAADCEKGTDRELVIRGCSGVITQDPLNAQAYFKRGDAYLMDKRDTDRAIEDFTKAIEIDPKHDKAYNSRGIAYGRTKDINREIEDYTKAIEINPKDEWAFLNRGSAYLDIYKYDLAFADYAKAIEINPKSDQAHIIRGKAYRDLSYRRGDDNAEEIAKNNERAHSDYSEAVRINPNNVEALKLRGVSYFSLYRDYGHAVADYSEAIRLDPDNSEAWSLRGHAYLSKGDTDHAIADYSKAIQLKPGSYVLALRCEALAITGQLQEALADCNAAVRLSSIEAPQRIHRGTVYLKLGQLDAAIADYDWVLARYDRARTPYSPDHQDAMALYGRGLAKQRKGDLAGSGADIAAANKRPGTAEEFARFGVK